MFIASVCCVFVDAAPVENAARNSTAGEDDIESTADNVSHVSNDYELDDMFFEGNTSANITEDGIEEEMILFEGDIVISLEELRKYYDINEATEKELVKVKVHESHVSKRAASSDPDKLWTNRRVPYELSSSFTASERANIRSAMDVLSSQTCIQFEERSGQSDYVYFETGDECSSKIGRVGDCQQITLTSLCASIQGKILHEICHALGLWHEQSRPDRDSYVTIHWDNIEEGKEGNFKKRKDKEVDYQGTGYDYGSVLHYGKRYFNNCPSCDTITVNAEGEPEIGQRDGLSPTDILQIKRLYKCPGPGQRGLLMLYIRNGVNLEDTDGFFGDPDPYVKVRAIDSNGQEVIRTTSHKQGTENPTWNTKMFFSDRHWQYFRISVWDSDFLSSDEAMGMSVTVPLLNQPNAATRQRYCTNTACNRYIWYDYKLLSVITECTYN